jgi:hypothetical protein
MKWLLITGVVLALLLLSFLTACQGEEHTPVPTGSSPSLTITEAPDGNDDTHTPVPTGSLPEPTGEEAPDDIVFTPGGYAYRANVNGSGPGELLPDIQGVNVTLGSGSDILNINYRNYIETKAGETRNNIIFMWGEGGIFDGSLELYSTGLPEGIGQAGYITKGAGN